MMRRMDDVRKKRIVQKKRGRITICSVGGLCGVAFGADTSVRHFEEVPKGFHPTGRERSGGEIAKVAARPVHAI